MERKFGRVEDYKRWRRHKRVRNRVAGTPERPRVAVFRSNQHIYAQLIDDEAGRTLLSVSSLKLEAPAAAKKAEKKAENTEAKAEGKKGGKATKAEKDAAKGGVGGKKMSLAREVGRLLAEAAQAKGFKKVAFDRGGYLYHGRVAALASSAREHGLDF